MPRNRSRKFCSDEDRSHTGPNVSAAAQSGSNITAPVLTNNTITGPVHITHNAPGNQTCSEKTQTSDIQSLIFKHKRLICSEYQYVTEYNSLPGEHVLLSERFTQPLIIQTYRSQKEREEEIRSGGENFQQVLSSRSSQDSVHLNSLFNPDGHRNSPSVVILQGNTGNGKSFTVQKIILDWASDNLYKEHFDIVFHLKCKEINRISGRKSLVEILRYSCSLTSDQISQILQHSPEKVLFIIDGFDELRLTQDIYHMLPNSDLLDKAPAEVTLCALLKGHILPESSLLVTTRSTAADTLTKLLKKPQRFSEIMGFTEKGVEEYFQKFFQNEELFKKAYEYMRSNETLIAACSIPVICWIICTVLQERFIEGSDLTSGLETTTSIYVDFVCTLLDHHCQGLSQSVPTLLRSLGQLAEKGILEQQVLFGEKSVNEAVSDPTGNPFLCKFLFKRRIQQETMFSFMHLSFQEFFTALYYVLLDKQEPQRKLEQIFTTLGCKDFCGWTPGHFLGVVQFAFGLLNINVNCILQKKHGLVVHPSTEAYLKNWILKKIKNNFTDSGVSSFLQCLYELHEEDFVKKAMDVWSDILSYGSLMRRTDYWALLYCSRCCQSISRLDLIGSKLTTENLMMILPVLHKFRNLSLYPEDPADSDLVEVMHALTRGRTLSSQNVHVFMLGACGNCSVESLLLSINEESSSISIGTGWNKDPVGSLENFSLTLPHAELININWAKLFQIIHRKDLDALSSILYAFSKLKKMEIRLGVLTEKWSLLTLQIIQNCCSLTELRVFAYFIQDKGMNILQSSRTRPDCIMSFRGYMCSKQTGKCTRYEECYSVCNQWVDFHLSSQGVYMETS